MRFIVHGSLRSSIATYADIDTSCGRRGGLMVNTLDSGSKGLGSSPGQVMKFLKWLGAATSTVYTRMYSSCGLLPALSGPKLNLLVNYNNK